MDELSAKAQDSEMKLNETESKLRDSAAREKQNEHEALGLRDTIAAYKQVQKQNEYETLGLKDTTAAYKQVQK